MPSRRRLLKMLGAAAGLGAGGWALLTGGRANAYYQGPPSDHFDGVRFFNPGAAGPKGPGALLKWQLGDRGEAWPASFPSPHPPDRPPARFDRDGLRVVLVGHASFLIQTRGLGVLVDPVWAERASPLSFAGPRRVNPPGIAFDDLPKIDAVLVTHNHYDHMDVETVGRLWQRFRPRIVTPLGNDAILRHGAPGLAADTVDWGDAVELGSGVVVHAEPTLHWSARGAGDRMHALWASFVVRAGNRKVYCVGDTGFGDGATFAGVGRRHPGLTLALLPIGAYEPRWFMRNHHMNPEEAVEALRLSGAAQAFGHHWGTFRLTNEGVEQPAHDLAAALRSRAMPPDRFGALRPGEVRLVA
ncbi:MAG TPA: MBL fold metallo-hydrolase [Hyphomicrobiaceae bacterium]|nr:MBL fold metallo-hydrolase [Hyphomicrobiaceae bacterium]